jgi:CDGSH-type Zn-finger protein
LVLPVARVRTLARLDAVLQQLIFLHSIGKLLLRQRFPRAKLCGTLERHAVLVVAGPGSFQIRIAPGCFRRRPVFRCGLSQRKPGRQGQHRRDTKSGKHANLPNDCILFFDAADEICGMEHYSQC